MGLDDITQENLSELDGAIRRAAPRVRYWYARPNSFFIRASEDYIDHNHLDIHFLNLKKAIKETGAVSDFEKLKDEHPFIEERYNSQNHHVSLPYRFMWKNLLGLKDIEICIYNPTNPSLTLPGIEDAKLVQIDGLGWGNTYDARVNLGSGDAIFNEEDQNIAHRLGLQYTPTGILEIDSCSASSSELHKDEPEFDEEGKLILYCDNPSCGKRVRNPQVALEGVTGGLYHSRICYNKDVPTKAYLMRDAEKEFEPQPRMITLEEATEMYHKGELQQSRHNSKKERTELRSVEPWPEAAVLFGV